MVIGVIGVNGLNATNLAIMELLADVEVVTVQYPNLVETNAMVNQMKQQYATHINAKVRTFCSLKFVHSHPAHFCFDLPNSSFHFIMCSLQLK